MIGWFKSPPEPPHYCIALINPAGKIVAKRTLRVWPDDPDAVKMRGGIIGEELAIDASMLDVQRRLANDR